MIKLSILLGSDLLVKGTHLHFQLGMHPPKTHDMPGAVAMANREEALSEYVDPRYVVGELY